MRRIRGKILAIAFAGFSIGLAQTTSFTASVGSERIAVGEQFQLSFTLTTAQPAQPEKFVPPDFSAFVVLSGPMQSSQYSWINGRASSSLSYVYVLAPRKEGKTVVGSASVVIKEKEYKTDPLQVVILPASQAGQASENPALKEIGDNLFIRATPDKQRVRVGEQFILTYKLYTRVSIENYFVVKAPTFEGFWAEDFEQSKSPDVSTQTIDGKQYRVATIKRTALFATQTGTLKISPLQVRCAVQVQTRRTQSDPFDIFNDPNFPNRFRTQELDFSSNQVSITVDGLKGAAPSGFTGAVGSFTFESSIDKKEVKTGDPVTLKLVVSGTGNIKLVTIPRPVFPADLESYEPRVTEEIARDGNSIRGKKTAEYLLIPRNAGTRVIEPLSFVFYDLQNGSYVTRTTPRYSLTVTPGKDLASGAAFASKEDIRLLGEDIRFLKLSPGSFRRVEESDSMSPWMIAGFLLPPMIFAGAFAYRKRREHLLGNISTVKSQKAGKEASRRLKTAQKLLAKGNTEEYHAEIAKALFGYLGDRLSIAPASLTLDHVLETLKMRGLQEEILGQVRSCIQGAEYARFAPGSDTQEGRRDLLEQATAVIRSIERSFR